MRLELHDLKKQNTVTRDRIQKRNAGDHPRRCLALPKNKQPQIGACRNCKEATLRPMGQQREPFIGSVKT